MIILFLLPENNASSALTTITLFLLINSLATLDDKRPTNIDLASTTIVVEPVKAEETAEEPKAAEEDNIEDNLDQQNKDE